MCRGFGECGIFSEEPIGEWRILAKPACKYLCANFGVGNSVMASARTTTSARATTKAEEVKPFWTPAKVAATACVVALAILLSPIAAMAQESKVLKDISARELAVLLDGARLETTVTAGPNGEPMVLAQKGKVRFLVRGVECQGSSVLATDHRCTKLQFRASFGLEAYPSATWMNDFNKKWVFGKAYVTPDGKAHVEYPMNLTNGITQGNLANNLVTWTSVLESFIEHLSEGEVAPLL